MLDAEIADRQDVGPGEGEDQEHLGRPLADALDGHELARHLLVGQLLQARELQLSGQDVLGEAAQRGGLGVREPGGRAQRIGVVGEDLLRRGGAAAEALEQAAVDGLGGPDGELLPGDRAQQRRIDVRGPLP